MHLIQVGAGSGGMPVLDLICREERIKHVTLIEPDEYKEHNVERHVFGRNAVGAYKADLARDWLLDRRDDLQVDVLPVDLTAEEEQPRIAAAATTADVGVCAADNEAAKYHWDALMRRHGVPWTLGEVLSGGIGGFVHWFVPGGPCYGCVASHLKRVDVDKTGNPDYSQPGGAVHETRIPASKASIAGIASMHAMTTLQLIESPREYDPGFTSLLISWQRVEGVFSEPFHVHKFRIPRLDSCLICRAGNDWEDASAEDLDAALDQALSRLADE